jgi:hypothetical protein
MWPWVRSGDAGPSQRGCAGVRRRTQHRQTRRSVKPMPIWTSCGQPNRDLGTGFEVRSELFWYSVSGFRRACSTRCYRTRCQDRRRSTQIRNRGRTSPRLGRRAIGLPCIPPSGRRSGDNLFIHKVLDTAEPGDVLVVNGSGDTTRALIGNLIRAQALRLVGFIVAGAVSRLTIPTHWPTSDYPSSHATSILRAPTRTRPSRRAGSCRQRGGCARRCRRRRCRRCLSRQECRCGSVHRWRWRPDEYCDIREPGGTGSATSSFAPTVPLPR